MKLAPETISSKIGKKIDINSVEEISLDNLGFTEVSSFSRLKSLKKLDLSNNRFQLIRHIKGLFDLPVIENLNLSSNPVTKQNNYRLIVIKNLPTLLILDEKQISSNERNQAREFDESIKDPLSKKAAVDEEEEEEEEVPTTKNTENVNKTSQTKQQQLFNDNNDDEENKSKKLDEDSLFGTRTHKKLVFEEDEEISLESISLSSLEKKKVEKKEPKKSLFEDDDGEDIFASIKKPSSSSSSSTTKKSNIDLDDDLFGDTSKNSENLSSDFDISSYISSQKNRGKSSLFD